MTIVGFSDYLSHAHFADRWRFVKDLDSLAGIMKESDAAVHLALHCHSFLCSNSLMFGCPINASRRFISPALPRKATIGQNVIVLMGSTGSGKTCFMHTIAGLLFQAGFFVMSGQELIPKSNGLSRDGWVPWFASFGVDQVNQM